MESKYISKRITCKEILTLYTVWSLKFNQNSLPYIISVYYVTSAELVTSAVQITSARTTRRPPVKSLDA